MNDKELNAISQVAAYCQKIERARLKFFPTKELFDEESLYRDGCAFYVQQIGEYVNDLSGEFVAAHPEVPWHQIRGFRNVIAHALETSMQRSFGRQSTRTSRGLRDFATSC